jgi:hypothetical protein
VVPHYNRVYGQLARASRAVDLTNRAGTRVCDERTARSCVASHHRRGFADLAVDAPTVGKLLVAGDGQVIKVCVRETGRSAQ